MRELSCEVASGSPPSLSDWAAEVSRSASHTMNPPFVVGLVGGIGSGKSTVAGMFRKEGALVIDADALAHRCLAEDAVVQAIRAEFGDDVVDARGAIDRGRLGARAFSSDSSRARLERIVHPCVLRRIEAEFAAASATDGPPRIVVLDAPLLLETGLDARCDVRVFVDAPVDERRRRVAATRGWAAGELERREIFQKSAPEKRAGAEYTIANVGPLEPLRARVREICGELRDRARRRTHPP